MVQLWQQWPRDDLSWQGDSEGIQGLFGGIRSPRQGFRVWDLSRDMVFTAASSQGPVPEFPLYNINGEPPEGVRVATRRAPVPSLLLEFYWAVPSRIMLYFLCPGELYLESRSRNTLRGAIER